MAKPDDHKGSHDAKSHGPAAAGVLADNIRLAELGNSAFGKLAAVGGAGVAVSVALGAMEGDGFTRFSYAYLTAFAWVLTIGLGALWWVTLQHLVNAKWSIALRRVGELMASAAPLLGVLALPIVVPLVLGTSALYEWADHAKAEANHLLHHKSPYLNPTFFAIRFLLYFGFWTWLSRYFLNLSLRQDTSAKPELVGSMQRMSGPAMFGFALTLTFCSIDFLMSLDTMWFSTIFGVYYFASCVLAFHSTIVLVLMWLQNNGRLKNAVTVEHYHDLGKMMFAFTIFWAYIGFSQFMLIWYANVPEETSWFKERFAGDWGQVSWLLLFGHFVIPFFGLLSRHVKRNRKALAFWAVWTLVMVYVDMYWLVMPNLHTEELPLKLVDLTIWVGLTGVFLAGVAYLARGKNLVAVKDPRLNKSLAFENI